MRPMSGKNPIPPSRQPQRGPAGPPKPKAPTPIPTALARQPAKPAPAAGKPATTQTKTAPPTKVASQPKPAAPLKGAPPAKPAHERRRPAVAADRPARREWVAMSLALAIVLLVIKVALLPKELT